MTSRRLKTQFTYWQTDMQMMQMPFAYQFKIM